MSGQSKSQVQVSITASLGPGFNQAFTAADRQMKKLADTGKNLNRQIGSIDAFTKQKRAVIDTKTAWEQATAKVATLKQEIAKSGTATRAQAGELSKATAAAKRASAAYNEQNASLQRMRQELQKAGINTGKLADEYRRLKKELADTAATQQRLDTLQRKADQDSIQRQHRLEDVLRRNKSIQEKQTLQMQRQKAFLDSMHGTWQKIGGITAGIVAGGAVLAQPAQKALSYEETIAYMADTGGAGKGVADKKALEGKLQEAIKSARKYGGGNRDDVAAGLSKLIANGMDPNQAMAMLPDIAKTAYASAAKPEEIAAIALRMKDFGVSNIGGGFDRAMMAGQKGSFELKDMARYLPEQMASATAAGYSGDKGLNDILTLNQVAMKTAGNADQAGNNVVNILNKLSSREFKGQANKAVGGKFDWTTYAQGNREKGISTAESVAMLVDRQLAKDKGYQALKQRYEGAQNGTEKKQALADMASMAEGSQVGQLIADRQALMAMLALMQSRKQIDPQSGKSVYDTLHSSISGASGTVAGSSEFIRGHAFSAVQDTKGNLDQANADLFNRVAGPVTNVIDGLNKMAEAHPKVTEAAYAAVTAIGAMTAAAATFGGMMLLTGGKAAGGGVIASVAQKLGMGGAMATGAAYMGKLGKFLKGGAIAGVAGYAADSAIGGLGVGGNEINQQQDDANWSKMSVWQKFQSSIPRGIEKAGSLFFLDNLANEAAASRVRNETAYFKAKEKPMGGAGSDWGTSSPAAAATAAKAKTSAAKPATPTVVQTNSYNVTVQAPAEPGSLALAEALNKALRERDKKAAADLRSSHFSQPDY